MKAVPSTLAVLSECKNDMDINVVNLHVVDIDVVSSDLAGISSCGFSPKRGAVHRPTARVPSGAGLATRRHRVGVVLFT